MEKEHEPVMDIAIIEDNESDYFILEQAFTSLNTGDVRLTHYDNGKTALKTLKELPVEKLPSLVLLDLNMPEMNGREVLLELKSNHFLKHIPVIILTTSANPNDINFCYKNYANCFLIKPLDFTKLVNMIVVLDKFWREFVTKPLKKII